MGNYPAAADVLHGSDGEFKWYPNESTFGGSLAAVSGYLIDVKDENIEEKIERISYAGIRRDKQPRKSRIGRRSVGGTLNLVANLELLGWVLQALLGPPDTKPAGTVRAAAFDGSGLNDLTSGGTFSGAQLTEYLVEIEATGSPDTFRWSKDGGANWVASGVAITGASQTLDSGVSVTFAATTGHAVGDRWWIIAHGQTGHLFQASGVTPPSFKLERSWSTLDRHLVYSGCRIAGLSMDLGSMWDGIIGVDIAGRNQEDDASAPLDASPTQLLAPWLAGPDMMVLKAGQQVFQVDSLSLKIDRGVDPKLYPAGGGGVVRSLPVGICKVTGNVSVYYEDAAWVSAARANSKFDLGVRIIDTESQPNTLDLRLPELTLTPVEAHVADEDQVTQFELNGYYETNSFGTMIRAILDNGVAGYAGP